MKIIHLTDIHSDFYNLQKVIGSENYDLVLISGDITHFGDETELKKALQFLDKKEVKYFTVTGNCDKPGCEVLLNKLLVSIDCKVIDLDDFQIAGLGGSLPCPGKTPNEYTEDEYASKIDQIETSLNVKKPLIFVTHQPPYNTLNDKVVAGMHVGSKSIRNFIEKISPAVCLTGHIHEGKGIDFIGKTPVINPGPLRNGSYATIELTGEFPPRIELHTLPQ